MDEDVFNQGYRAQAQGKDLVRDNPYPSSEANHWTWRKGFLQAHMDSK
jgi:hypothetical protein